MRGYVLFASVRFFDEKPFLRHFAVVTVHLLFSSLFDYIIAHVSLGELIVLLVLSLWGKSSSLPFCRSYIINFPDSNSSNALWSCCSSNTQFEHSEKRKSHIFLLYRSELFTLMLIAAAMLMVESWCASVVILVLFGALMQPWFKF